MKLSFLLSNFVEVIEVVLKREIQSNELVCLCWEGRWAARTKVAEKEKTMIDHD